MSDLKITDGNTLAVIVELTGRLLPRRPEREQRVTSGELEPPYKSVCPVVWLVWGLNPSPSAIHFFGNMEVWLRQQLHPENRQGSFGHNQLER